MAYSLEMFLEEYPEFAGVPEKNARLRFEQAGRMVSAAVWGAWRDMALGLWTAHSLAMEYDITAEAGQLGKRDAYAVSAVSSLSASTGSLSVTNAANPMLASEDPMTADLARSVYGMRCLHLLHTVVPAGCMVFSPDTSAAERR